MMTRITTRNLSVLLTLVASFAVAAAPSDEPSGTAASAPAAKTEEVHNNAAADSSDQTPAADSQARPGDAGSDKAVATIPVKVEPAPSAEKDAPVLYELEVTASFRRQSIRDTPVSITGFSSQRLDELGIKNVNDIVANTPGMSNNSRGPSRNDTTIRGVGRLIGQQDLLPSPVQVGNYLDDIPLNTLGGGQVDVRLFDVERVEVLRGPQGTLYGESSSGGAVKYITEDPDFSTFTGVMEAGGNSVQGGKATTRDIRGALNLPLWEDRLGLRLVANQSSQDGFTESVYEGSPQENPTNRPPGQAPRVHENLNAFDSLNLRGVLFAQITDEFTLRLAPYVDNTKLGAYWVTSFDPTQLRSVLRLADDSVRDELKLVPFKLAYDFGSFSVESISGYLNRVVSRNVYDGITAAVASLVTIPTQMRVADGHAVDTTDTTQLTQEVRFISEWDSPLSLVGGVYYKKGKQRIHGIGSSIDIPGTALYDASVDSDTKQVSVFSEASYAFTPAWSASAGLRYHTERLVALEQATDATAVRFEDIHADLRVKKFLPMARLEYKPGKNALYYARYATGTRNGNVNSQVTVALITDPAVKEKAKTYGPDFITAYELGSKYTLLDGSLTASAGLFYNEMKDLQVAAAVQGFTFVTNAAKARSYGGELELAYKLTPGWSLFMAGGYVKAELTEPLVVNSRLTIEKGAGLPYVSPYTISGGTQYIQPLFSDWALTMRVSGNYFAGADAILGPPDFPERIHKIERYSLLNFGLGVGNQSWSLDFRLDNALNRILIVSPNDYDSSVRALSQDNIRVPKGQSISEFYINSPRRMSLNLRFRF